MPLAAINDESEVGRKLLKAARRILDNLDKQSADTITAEDTADTKIFATTRFNGDGVVPPSSAEDETLAKAIADVIAQSVRHRPQWCRKASPRSLLIDSLKRPPPMTNGGRKEADASNILPLGEATEAAAKSFAAVKGKIDDFFTRAALAAL